MSKMPKIGEYSFFLRTDSNNEWLQVTEEEFIKAERESGFYPKSGDGVATGGFAGNEVIGKIERVY